MKPKGKEAIAVAEQAIEGMRLDYWDCWMCGWVYGKYFPHSRPPSLEIHHIGGRNHPEAHERANLARLCSHCHHDVVHKDLVGTLPRLLALKAIHDPDHYDRELVLRCRGKAPTAITEAEMIAAAKQEGERR